MLMLHTYQSQAIEQDEPPECHVSSCRHSHCVGATRLSPIVSEEMLLCFYMEEGTLQCTQLPYDLISQAEGNNTAAYIFCLIFMISLSTYCHHTNTHTGAAALQKLHT